VNYGSQRDLYFLTAISLPWEKVKPRGYEQIRVRILPEHPFPIPKTYDVNRPIEELVTELPGNVEGFVLLFSNGTRIKVKTAEYVALHSALSHTSTTTIWESLRSGTSLDILEQLPDETHQWAKTWINTLQVSHSNYCLDAKKEYFSIMDTMFETSVPAIRKEFALRATKSKFSPALFRLLDGRAIEDLAWKIVKPEYEKPSLRFEGE